MGFFKAENHNEVGEIEHKTWMLSKLNKILFKSVNCNVPHSHNSMYILNSYMVTLRRGKLSFAPALK